MTKHIESLRELEDRVRALTLTHGRGVLVSLNEKTGEIELADTATEKQEEPRKTEKSTSKEGR